MLSPIDDPEAVSAFIASVAPNANLETYGGLWERVEIGLKTIRLFQDRQTQRAT